MSQPLSFEQIVDARRSVRKYNSQADFDHNDVEEAIKLATLSPNSSNMQMWAFHRVISEEKRTQLAEICMGQNAAKTANELLVITVTPDKWKQRAEMNANVIRNAFGDRDDDTAKRALKYYEKLIPIIYNNDKIGLRGLGRKLFSAWVGRNKPMVREVTKEDVRVSLHKSAALAAMTFMYAMKNKGYDTCPLEGFDSKRAKKLLGLDNSDQICMIISCGVSTPDGIYSERHRVGAEEVIKTH
ncbi:nitroreductase family protein [Vibrio sp. ZSDE26]|uniref:Nitroreductase family protein n=1 Tax=Vibrio amylolyticus TaxID=2847292 RepID=A0A9X1XIE4_9VIBR|nr:nitroreductase family protein [Vibrio amylolyticus]MCK6262931.1 nitroreductase family protein [Vibrio amylolyticus]